MQDISPHLLGVLFVVVSTADLLGHPFGQFVPDEDQVIPARKAIVVVVHHGIAVLPHDLALPVELQQRPRGPADLLGTARIFGRECVNQEVPVFEQPRVLDALVVVPAVHHATLDVQDGGMVPPHRAEERVARKGEFRIVVNEAKRAISDPGHGGSL